MSSHVYTARRRARHLFHETGGQDSRFIEYMYRTVSHVYMKYRYLHLSHIEKNCVCGTAQYRCLLGGQSSGNAPCLLWWPQLLAFDTSMARHQGMALARRFVTAPHALRKHTWKHSHCSVVALPCVLFGLGLACFRRPERM